MFEEGENVPSARSSESGFTDFVQYQGAGSHLAAQGPGPAPPVRGGRRCSGPSQPKALDRPVMQSCLEHFQHFLSRLIALYIVPEPPGEATPPGTLPAEGTQLSLVRAEPGSGSGMVEKECVAAFTAACQLFLECSSFPVYIAEGNLKASSTQEEHFSTYREPGSHTLRTQSHAQYIPGTRKSHTYKPVTRIERTENQEVTRFEPR